MSGRDVEGRSFAPFLRTPDNMSTSGARKFVEKPEELEEDGPGDGFGEQVGQHRRARDVGHDDNLLADEVPEKLGGAKDVLRVLEGDRVEGHVDGGLRVGVHDRRATRVTVQTIQRIDSKQVATIAKRATKTENTA